MKIAIEPGAPIKHERGTLMRKTKVSLVEIIEQLEARDWTQYKKYITDKQKKKEAAQTKRDEYYANFNRLCSIRSLLDLISTFLKEQALTEEEFCKVLTQQEGWNDSIACSLLQGKSTPRSEVEIIGLARILMVPPRNLARFIMKHEMGISKIAGIDIDTNNYCNRYTGEDMTFWEEDV